MLLVSLDPPGPSPLGLQQRCKSVQQIFYPKFLTMASTCSTNDAEDLAHRDLAPRGCVAVSPRERGRHLQLSAERAQEYEEGREHRQLWQHIERLLVGGRLGVLRRKARRRGPDQGGCL